MIAYVTLGTQDMERAGRYYDALLAELGGRRFLENERIIVWASAPNAPMVSICKPWDGQAASVGNGVMVALGVDSKEKVDRLYKKALELGGTDEGAPGPRGPGFYIGYFRDLDGNKLNFFTPA